MFTGLIETVGVIRSIQISESGESRIIELGIEPELLSDTQRGDSIAVNGCCLTVTNLGDDFGRFDVSSETLSLTNLGVLKPGDRVNVERAMPLGKRLGGHLVSGHIDGQAELLKFSPSADGSDLTVKVNRALSRYTIKKGSATLDGISLTINDVTDFQDYSALRFTIIPETMAKTTLGNLPASWSFNIEVDMMAKFIERIEQRR